MYTLDFGLKFIYSDNFDLYGYCNADWAGKIKSRKSTSGYVFRLGNGTISWKSKKQPVVLCSAVQETVWLRNLLCSVDFEQLNSTTLYVDRQPRSNILIT